MAAANAATVRGDFADSTFTHFGVTSRFFRRDGRFFVNTEGADGRYADFEIRYTFGIDPLQQYLIELPGGRLQAFSVAWDTRPDAQGGQRWFHLYPDERIAPSDPLHWTRPAQNWNFMCAECHSTDLHKNYDGAAAVYHTTWSEISVGCEACHGPGGEQAERASRAATQGSASYEADDLRVDFAARDAHFQVDRCARCHARRLGDTQRRGDHFADVIAGGRAERRLTRGPTRHRSQARPQPCTPEAAARAGVTPPAPSGYDPCAAGVGQSSECFDGRPKAMAIEPT